MTDRIDQRPGVGVVLINWNGGEFTIPCIRSLMNGTIQPDRIVVVDNGSTDGSPELIAMTFAEVTIIRNASNVGFAGANNQGMEFLLKHGMDYIWILNNDTVVAENCLEILLKVARQHPDNAGLSAKIFYEHPPDQLWYAGAIRHAWHLGVKHIVTAVLDRQAIEGVIKVPFISGCCMFLPSWVLRRYGGLMTSYIGYSEDNEWCWRVIRQGGTLCYAPDAHLWHKLSASVAKNTGRQAGISLYALYLMIRNHLWTIRHHAVGIRKMFALIVNIGIQVRNIAGEILRRQIPIAKTSFQGLWHGLRNPVPDDVPRWKEA